MQHLDLDDEQAEAPATILTRTIADNRYPLSPQVRALRVIIAKLRPEPVREPLLLPKVYALRKAATARRRRAGPV